MTGNSIVSQKVKNAKNAENKLTKRKAEEKSKEEYLSKPSQATITDVKTEELDENIVIRFVVCLPNEQTGYVDFTEYMVSNDELDIFLDNIGCTVNDITDGLYTKVPVTYTEAQGWKLFYSRNKYELKLYNGKSNLRRIDKQTGYSRPIFKVAVIYHSMPVIFSIVSMLYTGLFNSGIAGLGFCLGLIAWFLVWFADAVWSGITSPRSTGINIY